MKIHSIRPIPALKPFVDRFATRIAYLGPIQIYNPLPARSDCFLEFYFEDTFRIVNVATAAIHQAPRVVLVGPHTRRREDLIHTGSLKVFHVHFTATGFTAIFGIPASAIVNTAVAAELVLGPSILRLADHLASVEAAKWPAIAERFILQQLGSRSSIHDGGLPARLANALKHSRAASPVALVASEAGRSVRQIERIFEHHVGVTPKLFLRLERLNRSLNLHRQDATIPWADLAFEAGYFDQSHMIRDFRDLTGETPTQFDALRHRAQSWASERKTEKDVAFVLSAAHDLSIPYC
jgi:AraC-like DNA-binding protein